MSDDRRPPDPTDIRDARRQREFAKLDSMHRFFAEWKDDLDLKLEEHRTGQKRRMRYELIASMIIGGLLGLAQSYLGPHAVNGVINAILGVLLARFLFTR